MRQSLFDGNGLPTSRSEAGTPPPSHQNHRRVSHKNSSGGSDRSNSPISRSHTPAILHPPNIAPQHMFDGVSLTEHTFHPSPSLPALHLRQPSPGSTTSLNDRHLEPPPSYESLQQSNTTLKTRVSELEIINDLFRDRVQELERTEMIHSQLRQALEQSQQREADLKERLGDLEREVSELRELRDAESMPRTKKPRVSDTSDYPDPPRISHSAF